MTRMSTRRVLTRLAIVGVLGAVASVLSSPAAGAADVPTPIGRFGDYVPTFGASGVNGTDCAAPTSQWVARDSVVTDWFGNRLSAKGSIAGFARTVVGDSPYPGGGRYRIDLYSTFYRGDDDHLHFFVGCEFHKYVRPGGQVYLSQSEPGSTQSDLGGVLTSSPSAVARSNIDGSSTGFAFVRGASGDLWYYQSGWHSLGGYFIGDPVAVTSNNGLQIDVFVVNQNGQVWDSRSTDGTHFAWLRATNADVGANWTNITAAYVGGEFRVVQLNTSTREVRVGHVDPAGRYAYSDSYLGGRSGPASQPWPKQGPVIIGNRIYDVMYPAGVGQHDLSAPASTDLDLGAPFGCAPTVHCTSP